MAAITWKNIDIPSANPLLPRGYGGGYGGSTESVDNGLDKLKEAMGLYRTAEDTTHDYRSNKNANAYLDKLAGYNSPEQLAAAQQSGELSSMRQGFGRDFDPSKVRGSEANMLDTLRTRVAAGQTYDIGQKTFGQRDRLEELRTIAATGALTPAQRDELGRMEGGSGVVANSVSAQQKAQELANTLASGASSRAVDSTNIALSNQNLMRSQLGNPEAIAVAEDTARTRRAEQIASNLANENLGNPSVDVQALLLKNGVGLKEIPGALAKYTAVGDVASALSPAQQAAVAAGTAKLEADFSRENFKPADIGGYDFTKAATDTSEQLKILAPLLREDNPTIGGFGVWGSTNQLGKVGAIDELGAVIRKFERDNPDIPPTVVSQIVAGSIKGTPLNEDFEIRGPDEKTIPKDKFEENMKLGASLYDRYKIAQRTYTEGKAKLDSSTAALTNEAKKLNRENTARERGKKVIQAAVTPTPPEQASGGPTGLELLSRKALKGYPK